MHAGLGGKVNYAAGLWDRYLFLQLLWTLQNGSGPALKYRAPSSSWASVDGRVHSSWTSDEGVEHCSPLVTTEVHIDYATSDPFGEIESAELKIVGPLLKVTLQTFSGRHGSGMPSATLHADGKLLATHEVHLDAWPQDGQEAHLIFICKDRYKELELSGLVLERVQERRGCYRRLGQFMTTAEGREDGMKWVRPGGRLSDNEYEEVLPSGDFRITVV
jgi:hypothetical protein